MACLCLLRPKSLERRLTSSGVGGSLEEKWPFFKNRKRHSLKVVILLAPVDFWKRAIGLAVINPVVCQTVRRNRMTVESLVHVDLHSVI